MSGYIVTVGDNHLGVGNSQCGTTGGNTLHREKIDVYCDPALKGRYVHVKLSGRKILNICEVKVFGEGGGNAQPTGIDTAGQSQISKIFSYAVILLLYIYNGIFCAKFEKKCFNTVPV